MKYNKLVRDKIPEIIRRNGGRPVTRKAKHSEYLQKLKEKLGEETREFAENSSIEELADILEVIDAIKDFFGITEKQLMAIKASKARARGKFKKRIVLEES